MWPARAMNHKYESVTQADADFEHQSLAAGEETSTGFPKNRRSRYAKNWILASIIFLLSFPFVLIVTEVGTTIKSQLRPPQSTTTDERESSSPRTCINPAKRLEWRELSDHQKIDYISAVKCLHSLPSQAASEGKLSDDFPWVHRNIGSFTHNAAPFLVWHRYFISIYENLLRTKCGYEGYLMYWDWTLDHVSPSSSPIFSGHNSFGSDGALNSTPIIGHATCVNSGPFANYKVQYFNGTSDPHCLSRGFGRESSLGVFSGETFAPEKIKEVMAAETYFDFSLALEKGPHNVIPNGIGGDFLGFEAPADPLFFLHHTQLDRLWWQWQRDGAQRGRWEEYNGPSRAHSNIPASLNDILPMGGLAKDIRVRDILSTRSNLLCYEY